MRIRTENGLIIGACKIWGKDEEFCSRHSHGEVISLALQARLREHRLKVIISVIEHAFKEHMQKQREVYRRDIARITGQEYRPLDQSVWRG